MNFATRWTAVLAALAVVTVARGAAAEDAPAAPAGQEQPAAATGTEGSQAPAADPAAPAESEEAAAGEEKPAEEAPLSAQAQEVESCLECHSDTELEIGLKSGETLNLAVDKAALDRSVHAGRLGCTECHVDLKGSEGGHPKKRFPSAREFTIEYSKACATCHGDMAKMVQDSVHQAALAKGNLKAAVCADCHGAHEVSRPDVPRSRVSKTCAKCHQGVYDVYAKSVHGAALLEGNRDVPNCTDCHRAHDIGDPKTANWKLETPSRCGACHSDAEKMKKYDLSPNVVKTYLADFHGTTASLDKDNPRGQPVVALCTDCHGVHDITQVKSADSKVIKENLTKTCQKCHPDATENFNAAWLSHYEPTLDKAPLVFGVRVFYLVVIPFMIGGLILQVLLHMWRMVVKR